jgi:hypothetical protein
MDNHPLKPKDLKIVCNSSAEGLDTDHILIRYGVEGDYGFKVPAQSWIFKSKWINTENATFNIYPFEDLNLYSIETKKTSTKSLFFEKSEFSFDIFETIFFHISRIEEYQTATEDGVIEEKRLFLVKNELEHIPVVDHLIYGFFKALNLCTEKPKTTMSLSHDADHLTKYIDKMEAFHFIGSVFRRNPKNVFKCLSNWLKVSFLHHNDPYQDWQHILNNSLSEKTIYFIVESDHPNDPKHISHASTAYAIEKALEKKYSIGLHPSYNTWNNAQQFKKQKMILERMAGLEISKSRQHYLHFSFPHTLDVLEASGISEDSSMGYNEYCGFRAGTGFPFRLYHVEKEIITEIIEVPMVWMDRAAWLKSGKNKKQFHINVEKFATDNRQLSHIHFNLHNSSFFDFSMYGIDLNEVLKTFQHEQ